MFSGKTTELIRRLTRARAAGEAVVAIKPARDTRSGTGRLLTHTGQALNAREAASTDDFAALIAGASVIGIDEAHFFGTGLADWFLKHSPLPRIILAGVSLDHFGDPFEPFASLEPHADEITELACPCAACGKPAIHSQRMGVSTSRIEVGGAGAYEPRCASCFVPSKRTK